MSLKLNIILFLSVLFLVPFVVNAELLGNIDGIDERVLSSDSTGSKTVVVAMVCCEEFKTVYTDPIVFNDAVRLRIRMKKGAVIQIYNNKDRVEMNYTCNQADQYNQCTKFFQVAYALTPINGIKVRTYCQKPAETLLRDPTKAFVGFTLKEGQVTIDGTDSSPISCMPKAKTADATDKLETKKSRKKAAR